MPSRVHHCDGEHTGNTAYLHQPEGLVTSLRGHRMPREPNLLALPKRNLMAMVPGGGLGFRYSTDNRKLTDFYVRLIMGKRRIRGS